MSFCALAPKTVAFPFRAKKRDGRIDQVGGGPAGAPASPYMFFAPSLRPDLPPELEGLGHLDGSARIQTVTEAQVC